MLIVLGSVGIGKTYLCSAILAHGLERSLSTRVWSENKLLAKIRELIGERGGSDYLHTLKRLVDDLLVVYDDFGSSGPNEWRRELLFEFVDYRYSSSYPTLITSNLTQLEIYQQYGKRTHSRLFSGANTVLELFDLPDRRISER